MGNLGEVSADEPASISWCSSAVNVRTEDMPLYSFMNCFMNDSTVFVVTAGGAKCLPGEFFLWIQFTKRAICNPVREGKANPSFLKKADISSSAQKNHPKTKQKNYSNKTNTHNPHKIERILGTGFFFSSQRDFPENIPRKSRLIYADCSVNVIIGGLSLYLANYSITFK